MKKKILVVFLICCMLLGFASPAMAAAPTPAPTWSTYIIFEGSIAGYMDRLPHTHYAIAAYDVPSGVVPNFYVDVTEDNISSLYISRDDTNDIKFGFYLYTLDDDNNYYWGGVGGSTSVSVARAGTSDPCEVTWSADGVYTSYSSLYSSSPLYILGTDEVFPPAPPLVNLTEELIQKTPEALDLDGKMKILVPFGLSCLALLISLPLLSNLLRRFLN